MKPAHYKNLEDLSEITTTYTEPLKNSYRNIAGNTLSCLTHDIKTQKNAICFYDKDAKSIVTRFLTKGEHEIVKAYQENKLSYNDKTNEFTILNHENSLQQNLKQHINAVSKNPYGYNNTLFSFKGIEKNEIDLAEDTVNKFGAGFKSTQKPTSQQKQDFALRTVTLLSKLDENAKIIDVETGASVDGGMEIPTFKDGKNQDFNNETTKFKLTYEGMDVTNVLPANIKLSFDYLKNSKNDDYTGLDKGNEVTKYEAKRKELEESYSKNSKVTNFIIDVCNLEENKISVPKSVGLTQKFIPETKEPYYSQQTNNKTLDTSQNNGIYQSPFHFSFGANSAFDAVISKKGEKETEFLVLYDEKQKSAKFIGGMGEVKDGNVDISNFGALDTARCEILEETGVILLGELEKQYFICKEENGKMTFFNNSDKINSITPPKDGSTLDIDGDKWDLKTLQEIEKKKIDVPLDAISGKKQGDYMIFMPLVLPTTKNYLKSQDVKTLQSLKNVAVSGSITTDNIGEEVKVHDHRNSIYSFNTSKPVVVPQYEGKNIDIMNNLFSTGNNLKNYRTNSTDGEHQELKTLLKKNNISELKMDEKGKKAQWVKASDLVEAMNRSIEFNHIPVLNSALEIMKEQEYSKASNMSTLNIKDLKLESDPTSKFTKEADKIKQNNNNDPKSNPKINNGQSQSIG